MFVVIQEIQLKKPNAYGVYKEFEVSSTTFSFSGVTKTHYSYYPKSDCGRFDRPHREAYKISIHQSYRESGKVKKKQCVIATIGYYALAEETWSLYDLMQSGINHAIAMFEESEDTIYDLVESKISPVRDRIRKEYHKTEEYKTDKERDKVQKKYQKVKTAFAKKYGVGEDEYDYCYNIFGEVMDKAYLDQIIQRAAAYSSYRTSGYSNYTAGSTDYSSAGYGGYSIPVHSNHTEEEKQYLKQFYKTLSLKFHPDMNPDKDTTKEMQLLNKLKEDWNL
jgi:hypothetical protein